MESKPCNEDFVVGDDSDDERTDNHGYARDMEIFVGPSICYDIVPNPFRSPVWNFCLCSRSQKAICADLLTINRHRFRPSGAISFASSSSLSCTEQASLLHDMNLMSELPRATISRVFAFRIFFDLIISQNFLFHFISQRGRIFRLEISMAKRSRFISSLSSKNWTLENWIF